MMVPMRATEIDHAAGIRKIVRHERDAAQCQGCIVPRLRKLVVCTAPDEAAAEAGDGCIIQHRAERGRSENVDVLGVDFLGCCHARAIGCNSLRAQVRVKVTTMRRATGKKRYPLIWYR